MKFFQLFVFLVSVSSCSSCKDDIGPKVNPCQVVHDNGAVFDTGYEFIDGSCVCPEGKYSAYGTCRELKENEWYGVSDGCPCVDTLFLWLKDFEGSAKAEFVMNEDIFDSFNLEPEYASRAARIGRSALFDYFTSSDGDSIAPAHLTNIMKCEIAGTGPEFDEVTLFGKFSPDNDTLFAKFIYRDGAHRLIVLDSCSVLFTR